MSSACWPRELQHSPPAARGGGAGGQALRGPPVSGGSRPCQLGPYSAIHPSTCTRESRWVAELAGSCRLERWASPGMPLEALYLRGPGGPHRGEAGPEPVRMAVPTPESPLSPVCSAGASVCPARGEGRRARPGTRAGSQAPPAWLTPQPRAPGLCRPRPAGAEAHLGVQVANNRDELRNDKQQRLVLPGIPEPLSTCACPCRPPGSPGTRCCHPRGGKKTSLGGDRRARRAACEGASASAADRPRGWAGRPACQTQSSRGGELAGPQ